MGIGKGGAKDGAEAAAMHLLTIKINSNSIYYQSDALPLIYKAMGFQRMNNGKYIFYGLAPCLTPLPVTSTYCGIGRPPVCRLYDSIGHDNRVILNASYWLLDDIKHGMEHPFNGRWQYIDLRNSARDAAYKLRTWAYVHKYWLQEKGIWAI